jgi:hypothetical protein
MNASFQQSIFLTVYQPGSHWTKPKNLFVGKALHARDLALFGKSPSALFCIAAGNSAKDLDTFTASPVDVPMVNKLFVAATNENRKMADFSCHGTTKVEVKTVLMGTVDKKDWLADKVRSGGVINPGRAIFAANLAKEGKPLDAAIAEARFLKEYCFCLPPGVYLHKERLREVTTWTGWFCWPG